MCVITRYETCCCNRVVETRITPCERQALRRASYLRWGRGPDSVGPCSFSTARSRPWFKCKRTRQMWGCGSKCPKGELDCFVEWYERQYGKHVGSLAELRVELNMDLHGLSFDDFETRRRC